MKKAGIYRITNLINNKVYIGQSIDIDTRWQMHKYQAFNYNSQHHLHRAFRKYGMLGHIWTEEQRLRMSNSRRNKYCGDNHYLSKMNIEERKKLIKGHSSFTDIWWNNGIIQRRCKTAPGPEWERGRIKTGHSGDSIIGTKWYNNGVISIRSKVCPDGFKPGRLKNISLPL